MTIQLVNNQNLWFISDTHIGHKNIVLGVTEWGLDRRQNCRNFDTVFQMNEVIIDNINNHAKPDDIIIHFGDVVMGGSAKYMGEFNERVVCKNRILIPGNHDKIELEYRKAFYVILPELCTLKVIETDGTKTNIIASHYPIASWSNIRKEYWMLHGHLHLPQNKKHLGLGKIMDVGVDGNNYNPYSLNELKKIMEKRPIESLIEFEKDHHHII